MHNKRFMLKNRSFLWTKDDRSNQCSKHRWVSVTGGRWACCEGSGGPVESATLNRLKLLRHVIINLQLVTSVMLDISLTKLIQNRGSRWV